MMEPNLSLLKSNVKLASAGTAVSYHPMETPGDRIRALRESKELTQERLAQRMTQRGAPITPEAISQWERGETKNIRPTNLLVLCQELDTTPEYIWLGPRRNGTPDRFGSASGSRKP